MANILEKYADYPSTFPEYWGSTDRAAKLAQLREFDSSGIRVSKQSQ
jgi:hypothetical protein